MYENIYQLIRIPAQKRNLRESTISLYSNNVSYFLRYIRKPLSSLSFEDADLFLSYKRSQGISPETYNHYRSAIRFFYKKVLLIDWADDLLPAMKRERHLPAVLSRA